MLVNQSPHQFGEVMVHIVHRNQGHNWRQINFNRECWLMLMGFPLDYWNHDCIQNALAGFGRVLLWENDKSFLARLLVKARVNYMMFLILLWLLTLKDFKENHGLFRLKSLSNNFLAIYQRMKMRFLLWV
jgi:hypothetical protein